MKKLRELLLGVKATGDICKVYPEPFRSNCWYRIYNFKYEFSFNVWSQIFNVGREYNRQRLWDYEDIGSVEKIKKS